MSLWDRMFTFDNYGELLGLLHNSIIAGALLGLIGGLIGVFVMMRDLTFAVHGISELSFAGAAFALLVGFNVVVGSILGSLVAALLIGVLGVRARERSSIIGVLMPFGLGLGVLFLALYPGRAANKLGLLTGQIVAVDDPQLIWMIGVSIVVLTALAIMWRPLMFATVDPEIAAARGVPVRALSPIFMIILGLTVAMAVQVVGAILVLALLVTPAAAAMRLTASALWVPVLSVVFGTVSVVGASSEPTTLPSARNFTSSACAAPRGSWVTITIVWANSVTDRRMNSSISADAFESKLPVGSSAKTSSGRPMSARAHATRCCWPPESSLGRCDKRSRIARSSTRRSNQPWSTFRPARSAGRVMFSRAESVGTRLKDWKTKPIRSRRSFVSALSSIALMSWSPTKTVPEVGESRPARQCMSVDLPDPDGPMMAVKRP